MRKFLIINKDILLFITASIALWRIALVGISMLAENFLPQRHGYIGPSVWANFDGVHYLSIAQNGYFQYEQAFFPLFPLLIRYTSYLTFGNYLWAGMIVVHTFLFLWLFLFYKLLVLDFSKMQAKWILLFALLFPTSFFFGSVYTETIFLFLVTACFYTARKEKWVLAGICIGLASATKLIGLFLLPAIVFMYYVVHKKHIVSFSSLRTLSAIILFGVSGLVSYMIYLQIVYKDALFFIHAQSAFGAHRTGGSIVFLPQVLFRYVKIFLTVSFSQYDTWIALVEFSFFLAFIIVLCLEILRKKIHLSYILFSLFAIVGPTLTGTLSSMPRYVLVAFPVFISLGIIKNTMVKAILLFISVLLFIIFTAFFVQGYFIS